MYIVLKMTKSTGNTETSAKTEFTPNPGKERWLLEIKLRSWGLDRDIPENVRLEAYIAQNEQANVNYNDLLKPVYSKEELFKLLEHPNADIRARVRP